MRLSLVAILLAIVSLFSGVTYATAAVRSLWGEIDEKDEVTITPIQPQPQPQPQQSIPQPEAAAVAATAPVVPEVVEQLSICQVLLAKTDLGVDGITATQMQEALKVTLNNAKPEYKLLLGDPVVTRDLYKQFRELYLQKNCKK